MAEDDTVMFSSIRPRARPDNVKPSPPFDPTKDDDDTPQEAKKLSIPVTDDSGDTIGSVSNDKVSFDQGFFDRYKASDDIAKKTRDSFKQVMDVKDLLNISDNVGFDNIAGNDVLTVGLGGGFRAFLGGRSVDRPVAGVGLKFAEGGAVDNEMEEILTEKKDPVSGNTAPVGATTAEVRDDIPIMASPNEFMINAATRRYYGTEFFENLQKAAEQGFKRIKAGEESFFRDDELETDQEPQKLQEGGVVNSQTEEVFSSGRNRPRRTVSQDYLDRSKEATKQSVENIVGMLPGVGTAMTVSNIKEELEKDNPDYGKVGMMVAGEAVGLVPGLGGVAKTLISKKIDDIWSYPDQLYDSAETSINVSKKPAGYNELKKRGDIKEGDLIVDIGGGKFDNLVDDAAEQGATVKVYDPFNRSPEHNKDVVESVRDGKADMAMSHNVLNVIQEDKNIINIARQAENAIKPNGKAHFSVYEGTGKGEGKVTTKGFQRNQKTQDYIRLIEEVFGKGNVTKKGKIITATKKETKGFNEGGEVKDIPDREIPQPTGGGFGGFGGTGEMFTGFEFKQYVHPSKPEIQIVFFNGRPLSPIPEGYTLKAVAPVEQQEQKREEDDRDRGSNLKDQPPSWRNTDPTDWSTSDFKQYIADTDKRKSKDVGKLTLVEKAILQLVGNVIFPGGGFALTKLANNSTLKQTDGINKKINSLLQSGKDADGNPLSDDTNNILFRAQYFANLANSNLDKTGQTKGTPIFDQPFFEKDDDDDPDTPPVLDTDKLKPSEDVLKEAFGEDYVEPDEDKQK